MYRRPQKREDLPQNIPWSDDISVLSESVAVGKKAAPNRIVYQAMEGCDGTHSGSPDELTVRRYLRFAAGGPGLIWFEATAILPEGRANPRQMWLTEENRDAFAALVEKIKSICLKENGYEPLLICQLTHSGRHSKPNGFPEPLIAVNKEIFEGEKALGTDRILSDSYLDALPERYAASARLAESAGFDGVDVKACHGYLLSELLSAYAREGKYGGTLENRERLLLDSVKAVKASVGGNMTVASRFNAYDGYPYPYGLGDSGVPGVPDLTEAKKIAADLVAAGVGLLDITMGNPYYNNEVNRPTAFAKAEEPLASAMRMINGAGEVASVCQSVPVVSTGWSFFGSLAPNVAAGCVKAGLSAMVGFGRQTFSYPDLARDIAAEREMKGDRLCLTCGKCTELMRAGSTPGCVVYDKEVYLPLYREKVMKKGDK